MEAACDRQPYAERHAPRIRGKPRAERAGAQGEDVTCQGQPACVATCCSYDGSRLQAKHPLRTSMSGWDSPRAAYRSADQSGKGPVVARFLASLPSPRYQSTWSLPSIHSISADVFSDVLSEDADSTHLSELPTSSCLGPYHSCGSRPCQHHSTADACEDSRSTASDEAESAVQVAPGRHHHIARQHTPPITGPWCSLHPLQDTPHTAESTTGPPVLTPVRTRGPPPAATNPAAAGPTTTNSSSSSHLSRRGLFVGNLPGGMTERQLMAAFSCCGPIASCWIARDARNQAPLGYGYVVYDAAADPEAHLRALGSLDGSLVLQQPITVRLSSRSFEDKAPPTAAGVAGVDVASP